MKARSNYICQQCGYTSASFMGRCPQCGEWNSLVESVPEESVVSRKSSYNIETELLKLSEVKNQKFMRVLTGYSEFDRVLGGGIVAGSIVLIAGDPGIGKSTLLLQCAINVAKSKQATVLYATGEESSQQVKMRADRIVKDSGNLFILATSSVEAIIEAVSKIKPTFLIVDSIQTLSTDMLEGPAGSVGQVRECAQILQRLAKRTSTPIFVVGHVTKEGNVAGPKVLEHLVDAVLNLEGDGMHTFRLLRSIKNRFGSTFEVGVFEMTDSGMNEVSNPSEIFLSQRLTDRPGSVVSCTIAGGRPLLAEIQALTNTTVFGLPARKITGLDFGRMQIVIASLGRSASLALGNMDVYVNVAGGLKVDEPAADLAAALAIASATLNKPVDAKICAFGEVGLLGELRMVGNIKNRMSEAKRMGFADFITPERFKTLEEAVRYAVK